jgi:hypothetical protein
MQTVASRFKSGSNADIADGISKEKYKSIKEVDN